MNAPFSSLKVCPSHKLRRNTYVRRNPRDQKQESPAHVSDSVHVGPGCEPEGEIEVAELRVVLGGHRSVRQIDDRVRRRPQTCQTRPSPVGSPQHLPKRAKELRPMPRSDRALIPWGSKTKDSDPAGDTCPDQTGSSKVWTGVDQFYILLRQRCDESETRSG
jgi:hypothetical protein